MSPEIDGKEADTGSIGQDIACWLRLNARFLRERPLIGWATLIGLFAGNYLASSMQVRLLQEMGRLTDALVHDKASLTRVTLLTIIVVCGAYLVGTVLTYFASYAYNILCRSALTADLLQRWLAYDRYYHLEITREIENPEQRIQEDVYLMLTHTTTVLTVLFSALGASILSWRQIWILSRPLPISVAGHIATIPAALFLSCVLVGVVSVFAAHFAGRRVTPVEMLRQGLDADFRHRLGEVREFAESIALAGGAPLEQLSALVSFDRIRVNWWRLTRAHLLLVVTNQIFFNITKIIPPLLCAGEVLAHRMTVGELAVATSTYALAMLSFSAFANEYFVIAQLRACVGRIRRFDRALQRPTARGVSMVRHGSTIRVTDVELRLPGGRALLAVDDLEIARGEHVLIRGASGSGKTSFLRSLAGIWPLGSGTVWMPQSNNIVFLPQRPHMPGGSLAALLAYPHAPNAFGQEDFVRVLEAVGLDRFAGRVDEHAAWRAILSPGEQQRISAARALLAKADFLFLDETTNALDPDGEADLYQCLVDALPNAGIISVSHNSTLNRFHGRRLSIADGRLLDEVPRAEAK